jgi:hypothetical protein
MGRLPRRRWCLSTIERMRLYIGAALLVVLVVGGTWLVLALTFGHSLNSGSDAYTRSATCVSHDRALAGDPTEAARFTSPGLRPLGIRWKHVRAVALFSDSLSPDSVDKADARIISSLRSKRVSPAEINSRLLHQDNLSLYYLTGPPSPAAQAAIGRCVYLVHYNRIASALGLYISPHAERPFLPGARRGD